MSHWKALLTVVILVVSVGGAIFEYGSVFVPGAHQTEEKSKSSSMRIMANFDNESVGSLPTYLQSGLTGGGTRSEWSIKQDQSSPSPPNVLAQTSDEPIDYHFPYVVIGGQSFGDVDVSVSFRTITGKLDQAAGLIFRFVDAGDYYVLRANALEGNVILYKFVAGSRMSIASAPEPVSSGQWHSMRVVATGSTLLGYLDGQFLINLTDSTYNQGKVGLWTKADSVTYFDNLAVTSMTPSVGQSTVASTNSNAGPPVVFSIREAIRFVTPIAMMNYSLVVTRLVKAVTSVALIVVPLVPGVVASLSPRNFTFSSGDVQTVGLQITVYGKENETILPVRFVATTSSGVTNTTYSFLMNRQLILITSGGELRPDKLEARVGQPVTWLSYVRPTESYDKFRISLLNDSTIISTGDVGLGMQVPGAGSHVFDRPGRYVYMVEVPGPLFFQGEVDVIP